MHYETYHDRQSTLAKENKELRHRVATETANIKADKRSKDIVNNMMKKFRRDSALRMVERCF